MRCFSFKEAATLPGLSGRPLTRRTPGRRSVPAKFSPDVGETFADHVASRDEKTAGIIPSPVLDFTADADRESNI